MEEFPPIGGKYQGRQSRSVIFLVKESRTQKDRQIGYNWYEAGDLSLGGKDNFFSLVGERFECPYLILCLLLSKTGNVHGQVLRLWFLDP